MSEMGGSILGEKKGEVMIEKVREVKMSFVNFLESVFQLLKSY